MKRLLLFSLLFFSATLAQAKLDYHFEQQLETISKITAEQALVCQSDETYLQGNDQLEKLESYRGASVYIKYFEVMGQKYYVDIHSFAQGEFDLYQEPETQAPPR
nr:hypothetical protein [uncultured Desulfuromonas sp.]